MPAPDYVDCLMNWVQSQLDDEAIFPSRVGVPFPNNFAAVVKSILRRLFRVYAHIYNHHFAQVCALSIEGKFPIYCARLRAKTLTARCFSQLISTLPIDTFCSSSLNSSWSSRVSLLLWSSSTKLSWAKHSGSLFVYFIPTRNLRRVCFLKILGIFCVNLFSNIQNLGVG